MTHEKPPLGTEGNAAVTRDGDAYTVAVHLDITALVTGATLVISDDGAGNRSATLQTLERVTGSRTVAKTRTIATW